MGETQDQPFQLSCSASLKIDHAGELFPRLGFTVTNLTLPSRAVVRFYNKRGTAEPMSGCGTSSWNLDYARSNPPEGILSSENRLFPVAPAR